MSSHGRLIVIAIAAVSALGAAACSETLDTGELEGELEAQIASRMGEDADAIEVSCPDSIDLEEGDTFECEATTEEETLNVVVTQDDDEGAVTWEIPDEE